MSNPSAPPSASLTEALGAATAAARTARLLVAVDFDGVIAPIVDDPSAVTALPESVTALRRLAMMPETMVAIVSGRECRSLEQFLVPTDDFVLIGSHGAETKGVPVDLSDDEQTALADLTSKLGTLVDQHPGFHMETKRLSVAAHSRRVLGERAVLEAALNDLVDRWPAKVVAGKEVVEFTLRHTTKGDALRGLIEAHAATAAVYVGDDVTDEDAFAALRPGDVGIKVGDGQTAAAYRVNNPVDVTDVLMAIANARAT